MLTHAEFTERRAADPKIDDAALVVDDNLGFVKDRTVSRLTEMVRWRYRHREQGQQSYCAGCIEGLPCPCVSVTV